MDRTICTVFALLACTLGGVGRTSLDVGGIETVIGGSGETSLLAGSGQGHRDEEKKGNASHDDLFRIEYKNRSMIFLFL